MFKLYIYVFFLASDSCCGIEIEIENCKIELVSKMLVSYKLLYNNRDKKQRQQQLFNFFCVRAGENVGRASKNLNHLCTCLIYPPVHSLNASNTFIITLKLHNITQSLAT